MKHLFFALILTIGCFAHADITGSGDDTSGTQTQTGTSNKLRDYFYTHPEILKAAIGMKVAIECQLYINPQERLMCLGASAKLIEALDIAPSMIHNQHVNVTFAKKLTELVQDANVQKVLQNFNADSGDVISLRKDVEAMPNSIGWSAFIAILFQDNLESHINYLRKVLPQTQADNVENLWTADQKFYDLMSVPGQLSQVYNTRTTSKGLYHFFVVKYLQEALVGNHVPTHVASVVTFLFNYVYELQEYESVLDTAFKDPKQITKRDTIADMYLGYNGAFVATGHVMPETEFAMHLSNDVPRALNVICTQ